LAPAERKARIAVTEAAAENWLAQGDALAPRVRFDLRFLLAQAYVAKQDFAQGTRLLRRLREDAPRDWRIAKALASALFDAGEFRESLVEWTPLVKALTRGEDPWLLSVAGACKCYIALNEPEKAKRLLDIVAETYADRGSRAVREKIAAVRAEVGKK
jgi:hypothetical protein